jgi:hypothetical protein
MNGINIKLDDDISVYEIADHCTDLSINSLSSNRIYLRRDEIIEIAKAMNITPEDLKE